MTYNEELNVIKDNFEMTSCFAPTHRAYWGKSNGKNVTRKNLMETLERLGYKLDSVIHAYGIGNNNENKVIKRMTIGDGYETEIIMGYFHYTYSLYRKACTYWFEDKDHQVIFTSKNLPFKTYSENE